MSGCDSVLVLNHRVECAALDAAAGLALLTAGVAAAPEDPSSPEALSSLVTAQLRPAPPYDAGPEAARLGATAMIDVSDGLLADLGHVAAASGVHVNVHTSRLAPGTALREAAASLPASSASSRTNPAYSPPPIPLEVAKAATREFSGAAGPLDSPAGVAGEGRLAAMALEWVLTGGEDHALVAAFPPEVTLPARWRLIGEVRSGAGVTVDGTPHEGPGGWQHFS